MAPILSAADELETMIKDFISNNADGGVLYLPSNIDDGLVVPLMIVTFNREGWDLFYDCNDDCSWLDIRKSSDLDYYGGCD